MSEYLGGEPDQFEKLVDSLARLLLRPPLPARNHRNVAFDRKVRKESRVLNDVTYMPPKLDRIPVDGGFAIDSNLAAGGFEQAID